MDAEVVVVDVAGPEAPSPGGAAGARAEPSEGAQLFGASDAGEKTYTVVCPAGAAPGDQLQIDIEDETLLARVPEGVAPGETFPVTAPRAGAAPPPAATPVAMPPPTVATRAPASRRPASASRRALADRRDAAQARAERRGLRARAPAARARPPLPPRRGPAPRRERRARRRRRARRPRPHAVSGGAPADDGARRYALSDDEQLVVNYRHSIKRFAAPMPRLQPDHFDATRTIDSSQDQPNRLRRDRARETPRTSG